MLSLPILNVRLQACSEDWQQMTPTAQGRHCAHCDRPVVDFTQATAADLEAARAAAPDGWLCGRFRHSQLAATATPQPQLRPKLRRFLVVLVLVCGLGLSGREALAQLRTGVKATYEEGELIGKPYTYVETPPTFPGGNEAMLTFIAQHTRYPKGNIQSGKVFVNFWVRADGYISNVKIQKGLAPDLDPEALRVVKSMPLWTPGRQNGHPVHVSFTLPVTFANSAALPDSQKSKK